MAQPMRYIPKALVQANAEQTDLRAFQVAEHFQKQGLRRGLAAFNDLQFVFGKNLTEKSSS